MENYYRKYKLSSLYFGAYHSGELYYFPTNTLSEIEFNRFNNPYYIDFLDLPKNGIISLFNYLEPIYDKTNISGADKVYTLPTRTDRINVELKKIKDLYLENIPTRNLDASINYFGNNLKFVYSTFVRQIIVKGAGTTASDGVYTRSNIDENFSGPNGFISFNGSIWRLYNYSLGQYAYKSPTSDDSGPTPGSWAIDNGLSPIPSVQYITSDNKADLNANEWSNEEDLLGLINKLNFGYIGNINNSGSFSQFTGKGYLLKDCSGCADVATLTKVSGVPDIFCKDPYVQTFSIDIEYNPYNLISEIEKRVTLNSEKIDISDKLSTEIFIGSSYNNDILKDIFDISTLNADKTFIKDKNHVPLFFRNLNLNSKKLVPIVSGEYSENEILNKSISAISSYRYVPNIDSQKVFGSRIIDEQNILNTKNITIAGYSKKIYDALYSGNEVYEYNVETGSYIPENQQNQESYFKYTNPFGNDELIERRPVQTRLVLNTGTTFLELPIPSGSFLGYSTSINGSGNTLLITAPNAKVNNLERAGLVTVYTGLGLNVGIAAKLTGSNTYQDHTFGYSSCMNNKGDIFAIGAPLSNINNISGAGAVYIFTGNSPNWSEVQILSGNPIGTGNQFGISLAMNARGNVLAVGENRISGSNGISGAVYIFTGNGNKWTQYNKIYKPASSPLNLSDTGDNNFGFSIAMNNSGNKIIIGAPNESLTGRAYIFTGDSYGNKNWILNDTINPTITNNANSGDIFGYSVSINSSGNILAIGAPGFTNGNGLCAIIKQDQPNSGIFLFTGNPEISGLFGFSTALNSSGNILFVGSPFADLYFSGIDLKIPRAGMVSTFVNNTGWEPFNSYTNLSEGEFLGFSIDINDSGDIKIAGAPNANDDGNQLPLAGTYYIFNSNIFSTENILINENPIEEYNIPNIKIQLDASDRYSVGNDIVGSKIVYWKNKVNFNNQEYKNLYNSGDAITMYSDIDLLDVDNSQASGILYYNNPSSQDFISISNNKFTHSINFTGITGLSNSINTGIYSNIYRIKSQVLDNNRILLTSSGNNFTKNKIKGIPIITNYFSGEKKPFFFDNPKHGLPNIKEQLAPIVNNITKIYGSRFEETDIIHPSNYIFLNKAGFDDYYLAILNNNKITGFGRNVSGRLAGAISNDVDNFFTGNWNTSPVGYLTGVVDLSIGRNFAIALLTGGRVTGWGNNTSGQALGGNSLTGVIGISAGRDHSLALLSNQRLTGWGDNSYGQALIGNNLTGVSGISAGVFHSLALLVNGKVTGWGDNTYGQALSGNSLNEVNNISAGYKSSLATTSNIFRVTGWGQGLDVNSINPVIFNPAVKRFNIKKVESNLYDDPILLNKSGKLDYGGPDVNLTGIIDISAGVFHSLALLNNDKVTGWGDDTYGQALSGNNLTGVSGIAAGYNSSLAVLKNGKITGWGLNTFGQIAGTTGDISNWSQTPVGQITGATQVAIGLAGFHSFAILNNKTLTGWGDDGFNRISDGKDLTGVIDISLGSTHSLALLDNGKITGWGDDDYGQALGGNNLTGVSGISAGIYHSLALLNNGKVTGWGYNGNGRALDGNVLTGVKSIKAGLDSSLAVFNQSNLTGIDAVTGWGYTADASILYNSIRTTISGSTGVYELNAGMFYSTIISGQGTGKKIINHGQIQYNFDQINFSDHRTANQTEFEKLKKYQTAFGTKSFIVLAENKDSGSMYIENYKNQFSAIATNLTTVLQSTNKDISYGYLSGEKYSYSLTGSGFFNAVENYPIDDVLLPEYQIRNIPSVYLSSFSTMVITGYNASLPISIFFIEYGQPNNYQKTIQSYNKTGCYISTFNTGKLINLTGIGNPIKVNEPFYSDIQIGNLIMDTGRFEYYISDRLIYSGSTGFNFGQILLGNNIKYSGTQPVSTFDSLAGLGNIFESLTGIDKAMDGNLFEVLIYDSGLSDLHRKEVHYYLKQKWNAFSRYYPRNTIELNNRVSFPAKTKTNCSDCFSQLNNLPKQGEPHVLLFEYNLYGYPETDIIDCDMDMHVHILKTGFYEESKKEPITSNLSISYISGTEQQNISAINARSQNVYNVSDFNFGYESIKPSINSYKSLKSNISLKNPTRYYSTGNYLKYPKIDGIGNKT